MMQKHKIALDVGDVRIGVAVSDLLGITANPRETYVRKKNDVDADIAYFCEYAKREDADAFVLGLPKNMDGTEGPRAEKARQFKALLEEASGLPVILWDERRSTIEAHAILHAAGKKEKKHRANVDAVAATLLLEGYLASPNR